MKNSLTPAGIEPATFRFVAQHLNHCATASPARGHFITRLRQTLGSTLSDSYRGLLIRVKLPGYQSISCSLHTTMVALGKFVNKTFIDMRQKVSSVCSENRLVDVRHSLKECENALSMSFLGKLDLVHLRVTIAFPASRCFLPSRVE